LHPLTSRNVLLADLDGNGKDDVVIDFGPPFGLWQYLNSSTWSQLHGISPVGIAAGRFY
jgi:hypothetical protein